jgi:mono/diheme cytochrome c family protein
MSRHASRERFLSRAFCAGVAVCFAASWSAAQERAAKSAASGDVLFADSVHPALQKYCMGCHNSQVKQSGLDLSSRESMLRGGDRGAAITPGDARASLLYKLVKHEEEPGMPYKGDKLPDEVISQLAGWIDAGAPFDESTAERTAGASASKTSVAEVKSGSTDGPAIFTEQVRPLLETRCLMCHGGDKTVRSGLNLSTREGLIAGGDNGPAVIPGDARNSALYKRLRHELQPGMPFQMEKVPDTVIARVADWINAGAPYDAPLKLSAKGGQAVPLPGSDHWAFKVPKRPSLPVVKSSTWVRNPIDAFIAAEQEKRGLRPLPPADQRVLLRRVYLDLIGLPPTPEEVEAFLGDRSNNAYEKVVDRLLASPRYGERWGRHWMDVWRYSDWYGSGDEVRYSQRNIWHWRDWIIESVNQDKGYDRMILEMLAADELAPDDPKALRATGYLVRDWYKFNRNVWLQETVEHTAAGFLGITLKCARCHDHKYDPISQEEYYRFRAFFEPYDVRTERLPGQPDLARDGLARIYDAEPREQTPEPNVVPAIYKDTYRFVRGDEKTPDTSKPLSPGVPEILGHSDIRIQAINLPWDAYHPDLKLFVLQDLVEQATEEIKKSEAALTRSRQSVSEALQRAALHTWQQSASASPGLDAASRESFEKGVMPILKQHCVSCHSADSQRSGLALDTPESALLGGTLNGPAAIATKSGESPLILYLRGEKKPRMPLGGAALADGQIATIAKWIDALPPENPEVVLKKAEDAAALAEKHLAAVRAKLPALEARIAADKAKYSEPSDPAVDKLAEAARKAQRQADVLTAEEEVLRAQQQLAEAEGLSAPENDKLREKRVAAASKQLDDALATLKQSADGYTPVDRDYPHTSSGRRLALANWIASKDNPLTARVAINHIWLRHFGKALVPTVVNFGRNGKPPSHPELLDWLACELMDGNWHLKPIHRLIVTSSAYRMQSSLSDPGNPNLALDSENKYLWRMNPRRMEAEVVRDSVLYLAGQLDTAVGGPDLDESQGEESHRRTVYFHHTPQTQMLFAKLFDAPDPTDCYQRTESIMPQQALALTNSNLSHVEARLLAQHISAEAGSKASDAAFISAAFETVLTRPPSPEEQAASEKFLREEIAMLGDPGKLTPFRSGGAAAVPPGKDPHMRARENLVHALLNHNDFVTIR